MGDGWLAKRMVWLVALWLSLAHVQDARLRSPKDAVESLQQARKVDPIHPVPPEEIARIRQLLDEMEGGPR